MIFYIFKRLSRMQLKLSILFVFLVLYIQKHIRKYKHTHPSFFTNEPLHLYKLKIFTQHCN